MILVNKLHLVLLVAAFGVGVAARPSISNVLRGDADPKSPRLTQFETLNDGVYDVVMLGDSLTDNGLWSERLPGIRVANRGVGRDTVRSVLDRVHQIPQTGVVFVLVGTNDLRRERDPRRIAEDYRQLLARLRGRRVVVQSVISPQGDDTDTLNNLLEALAYEEGASYLDLRDTLAEFDSYTYDGVHLNGRGYEKWAQEIRAHWN